MSDYDYLNARIRGMSTSLLSREFYEQMLSAAADNVFLDALLSSPYAEDLRLALAARAGEPTVRAVEAALRQNGHAVFARLLSIAPPEPRRLIAVELNLWDVANVMALLRGKVSAAGPHDVLDGVLPLGELDAVQLGELAAETTVQSLADALPTWKHAFAFMLRRAIRDCQRQDDLVALEDALYRSYFQWALAQLGTGDPYQEPVRESIRQQVDLANVRAALARVRDTERGKERDAPVPIPCGRLSEKTVAELGSRDTLEEAFEALEGTYFAPGVEKGILAYGQSRSLANMERFLEAVVLERLCRLFRQDMLSIAVALGFIWRKYGELANLRMLARGWAYRIPANAMREGMILV
jgi:V/A-type H+/Na+-transporting ATPase subunit C